MPTLRILKIHTKFRVRKWDTVAVPVIRLEGKWLEKLGFKPGKEIIIDQRRKKLIVTVKGESEN